MGKVGIQSVGYPLLLCIGAKERRSATIQSQHWLLILLTISGDAIPIVV
jgi:hypothetical protein